MVTSGGVPARSHGVTTGMGGSAPPCVCSGGELDAGHELETCRPSAACPENMHSPKVDWARRACETRTSTHAALVGATVHGLEWPHVSPIHRQGQDTGQFQLVIEKSDTRIWREDPGKGEAPAVVGKLQGPLASHQPQLDRTHEPIL